MGKVFKPLSDRILIKQVEAETKTASGIIIPNASTEKPLEGKVIALGVGKKGEPLTVAVGDSVVFGTHSGMEIKIGNESFLIMREADIYGIL